MPEAVASSSTRLPEDQPLYGWKHQFSVDYEEIDAMLAAFREMSAALYETGEDHSKESFGIYLIQGLIMSRLKEVSEQVAGYLGTIEPVQELPALSPGLDAAVLMRIVEIRTQALLDAGILADRDAPWPEGLGENNFQKAGTYYNDLINKAYDEGDIDLLTIGSYLPWLEMRIRRDLGVAPTGDEVQTAERHPVNHDNQSLRDRLITEQAEAGVSVPDISQAFGIKRATVERIIGRLTATKEDVCKAV